MKKLLSIMAAFTVVSTSATTLVSCKVLTNKYDINLNSASIDKQIKYAWNATKGEYELSQEAATPTEVKNSVNGILGYGNNIVADILNVLLYNSDTRIVNNFTSLQSQQYVFKTDKENIYSDGQVKTAGIGSKDKAKDEEAIKEYYTNYEQSGKGIASILGLYQYSKFKNEQVKQQTAAESTQVYPIENMTSEKTKMIEGMFNSSNNQGITSVEFKNELGIVDGSIGLGEVETTNSREEEVKLQKFKINEYSTPFISKDKANYNNSVKYGDKDKKLDSFISATNWTLDPFSQGLISAPISEENIKKEVTIQQVKEPKDFNKENKQGTILNNVDNIVYEYAWSGKDNQTLTTNTYGYQLIELAPIELEITYNTNLRLKDGVKLGEDYKINVTVEGLNAAFLPVLSFISNDSKTADGKEESEAAKKLHKKVPYVGWRFAGYQFNSTNALGFSDKGEALTKDDLPFKDKYLPLWNKKYNEFAITSFDINKVQKQD